MRSIATGERNGNHKARLATYAVLRSVTAVAVGATLRQWVDDVPITAVGPKSFLKQVIPAAVQEAKEQFKE
eukprot:1591442-Lingulodinium_polyedra.AAC.1